MTQRRELDDPRRRILVRALSLGLLTPLPIALARAETYGAPAKLPAGQCIYRLVGEVTVNGKPADMKTVINPGDTVKTAKGAEVVFVVGTQAMIMRGSGEMAIDRPAEASGFVKAFRILTGAILSVSRSERMQIKTSTGTVGIRGTGFYVEAQPDQSYFCTCYGVSEVAAAREPEKMETIIAQHHDRPVYLVGAGSSGAGIRNAPFINHTDQELALIEALVGREPPFVFPKDSYTAPRRNY
jgi:hypothetical protein